MCSFGAPSSHFPASALLRRSDKGKNIPTSFWFSRCLTRSFLLPVSLLSSRPPALFGRVRNSSRHCSPAEQPPTICRDSAPNPKEQSLVRAPASLRLFLPLFTQPSAFAGRENTSQPPWVAERLKLRPSKMTETALCRYRAVSRARPQANHA